MVGWLKALLSKYDLRVACPECKHEGAALKVPKGAEGEEEFTCPEGHTAKRSAQRMEYFRRHHDMTSHSGQT
jgi:hypothetical protein